MDFTPVYVAYWMFLGVGLYFLPSMIAWRRLLKSAPQITKVNAALGWTLVGWLVPLVWALKRSHRIRRPSNAEYGRKRMARAGVWTILVLSGLSAITVAGGIDLFQPVETVASSFGGAGIFAITEEGLRADFERQGLAAVKQAYETGQLTGTDRAAAKRWLGEQNVPASELKGK
ncbi:MAG TPA: superinfection immunity protein [Alphaproteobacteria bacterium]|nr:superinfection immunity protein [Alphaproteobacteria bacterium]